MNGRLLGLLVDKILRDFLYYHKWRVRTIPTYRDYQLYTVVSLWNNLPHHVKVSPLSVLRHMDHIIPVAFCQFVTNIFS